MMHDSERCGQILFAALLLLAQLSGGCKADPPNLCPPLAGDMNNDGSVDGCDVQPFIDCLMSDGGSACQSGDFNHDGQVDQPDVPPFVDTIITPPSSAVPERTWLMTVARNADGSPATIVDFSQSALPADFFGPGSDPFTGVVSFRGTPLDSSGMGTTDTILARGEPQFPPGIPVTAPVVCVQAMQYSLTSAAPVLVTFNGGQQSALWNVALTASSVAAPSGALTATKTHANGGVAEIVLPVLPAFTFSEADRPENTRQIDFGVEHRSAFVLSAHACPWVAHVNDTTGVVTPSATFNLGIDEDVNTGAQTPRSIALTADGASPVMRATLAPPYQPNPTGYISVTENAVSDACSPGARLSVVISATWVAARCGIANMSIVNVRNGEVLASQELGCAPTGTLTVTADLDPADVVRTVVETCGAHGDPLVCEAVTDDIVSAPIAGATYLSIGSDDASDQESRTLTCAAASGGSYWSRTLTGKGDVSPPYVTGSSYALRAVNSSSSVDDIVIDRSERDADGDLSMSQARLTVVKFEISRLTFAGAGLHPIAEDATGIDYPAPHWQKGDPAGESEETESRRIPVCYTRNTPVAVSDVRFHVTPPGLPGCGVDVRGIGPDGQLLASDARPVGGDYIMEAVASLTPLPNTVKFYDPFHIQWRVQYPGAAMAAAGATDNRLYAVLDDPIAMPLYETAVHLACKDADGQSDRAGTIAHIWSQFAARDVRRKPVDGFNRPDGVRMGFWRSRSDVAYSLAPMLASPTGDAACGGWAELFNACVRAHGIPSILMDIHPDPDRFPTADGFLVKNWAFGPSANAGANGINNSILAGDDILIFPRGQGFPFASCIVAGPNGVIDSVPGGDDILTGNEINSGPNGICETPALGDDVAYFGPGSGRPHTPCIQAGPNGVLDSVVLDDDVAITTDPLPGDFPYAIGGTVVNLFGAPGQDNAEPPEQFGNHLISWCNGRLYDPSYGLGPFLTENDHENAVLAGIRQVQFARPNDPAVQELRYYPQN